MEFMDLEHGTLRSLDKLPADHAMIKDRDGCFEGHHPSIKSLTARFRPTGEVRSILGSSGRYGGQPFISSGFPRLSIITDWKKNSWCECFPSYEPRTYVDKDGQLRWYINTIAVMAGDMWPTKVST